jgi:hypothetical protein
LKRLFDYVLTSASCSFHNSIILEILELVVVYLLTSASHSFHSSIILEILELVVVYLLTSASYSFHDLIALKREPDSVRSITSSLSSRWAWRYLQEKIFADLIFLKKTSIWA